jgi:uncharacterized membrane protein|tara:strand:+ start:25 stop:258 length:234 start_codon:yes stop_codon:yes gene_type:complete
VEQIINIPFLGFIITSLLTYYLFKQSDRVTDYIKKNEDKWFNYKISRLVSVIYLLGLTFLGYWIIRFLVRDIVNFAL